MVSLDVRVMNVFVFNLLRFECVCTIRTLSSIVLWTYDGLRV